MVFEYRDSDKPNFYLGAWAVREGRMGYMTRTPDIDLTAQEHAWLGQIDFSRRHDDATVRSLEPMAALYQSLLARGGIPVERLRYYTVPDRYPGGQGRSREAWYEANGAPANGAHLEASFLPRLEYYVFGPNLPADIVAAFRQAALSDGRLSSWEIERLKPGAMQVVRALPQEISVSAEEFLKLAFECGAQPTAAASLWESLCKARR